MPLSERKNKILKLIVESYIETGEPIGSKALCECMNNSVSPATIRNDMADLAALGFLEQPHTSAGRVPTPMGYRTYVNELTEKQRRVVLGYYFEQKNICRLAEEYGVNKSSISRMLHRAEHRMKQYLKY